tara:strand:+ start:659 stop:1027 length:369 start_codon:yes stop_codon:yes gene_type:complete
MSVNNHVLGNNPIWDNSVQTRKVDLSAGAGVDTLTFGIDDLISSSSAHITGGSQMGGAITHLVISNPGPVNIFVGTPGDPADLTLGVLVQPGGSFSFAVAGNAQITVNDATKTAVFSVLMFS